MDFKVSHEKVEVEYDIFDMVRTINTRYVVFKFNNPGRLD